MARAPEVRSQRGWCVAPVPVVELVDIVPGFARAVEESIKEHFQYASPVGPTEKLSELREDGPHGLLGQPHEAPPKGIVVGGTPGQRTAARNPLAGSRACASVCARRG